MGDNVNVLEGVNVMVNVDVGGTRQDRVAESDKSSTKTKSPSL